MHLAFIPAGEYRNNTRNNRVIAVHEDGQVSCYSEDLEGKEWNTKAELGLANDKESSQIHVELVAITNAAQAKRSILSHREDVLAALEGSADEEQNLLLLLLNRSMPLGNTGESTSLTLEIFRIKNSSLKPDGLISSAGGGLEKLVSLAIPEPANFQAQKGRFTLHIGSGTLYQQTSRTLAVYDLSGLLPKVAHQLFFDQNDVSSCLRLSSTLLAISKPSSLSVIGLPYCSLQAERTITSPRESQSDTQSSKRNMSHPKHSALQFLSFFSPLNLIVALEGRRLVAIQIIISTTKVAGSQKRKRNGLLVDSIGRGSSSVEGGPSHSEISGSKIKSLGAYLPLRNEHGWMNQKIALDSYFTEGRMEEFETMMAAELGVDLPRHNHVDQRKICYTLGKIFVIDVDKYLINEDNDTAPKQLLVRMFPGKICDWLMEKGLLTVDQVEISLRHNGSLPATGNLMPGALIDALAQWDESLQCLTSLLASQTLLSPTELVHALIAVIYPSSSAEATESTKLLTNGKSQVPHSPPSNDHKLDLSPTPSTLPLLISSDQTHHLLGLTLSRLSKHPSRTLIHALRKHLSPRDTHTLIDILRLEIARAGWLSTYSDNEPPTPPTANPQQTPPLTHLTHLLCALLDALGPTGWIQASTDLLTEPADTLSYMNAEISAALEGIEEATYLKGILGEMLLCGQRTNPKASHAALAPAPAPRAAEDSILPLGLHPSAGALPSATKVGAGGELMQRSRRDIGRLKSRTVGKYGFERIVI